MEELFLVQVILPIAIPKIYSYSVPQEFIPILQKGQRVEVEFGRTKRYAGLVYSINKVKIDSRHLKPILSIIDKVPLVSETQFKLWRWMANYYASSMGQVMNAAVPAGLKLASETKVILSPFFDKGYEDLNDKEFLIAEALSIQSELSLDEVRKILNQKSVYPIIHQLLEKKMIYLKETISEKTKPKMVSAVRFADLYVNAPEKMQEALKLAGRSDRQLEAIMGLIDLGRKNQVVLSKELYTKANINRSILKALEKKGIVVLYEHEVSRIGYLKKQENYKLELSEVQAIALKEIKEIHQERAVCMLHGVTGSGKTEIYIKLIEEYLAKEKQVLYLLPEIGLTAQITERLGKLFGDDMIIYHSRLNTAERVEIWKKVRKGANLIVGVRSSLFLPLDHLGLIIVDESHDSSYKQNDPAPRYQGRDTAIYLAALNKAKVLLGSATPSLESKFNIKEGKYGLVSLFDRYNNVSLPTIEIIDLNEERKKSRLHNHFSQTLLDGIQETLDNKEQVILFKNRRGYAPSIACNLCDWRKQCKNCDVSLTYHKYNHSLQCHYCGSRYEVPTECPSCGSLDLSIRGYGTEKIEDELKVFFPTARIGRMDLDTVRGKTAFGRLLLDFSTGQLDILVGTQMVTKGLDFDKVTLVGVLSADQLLYYPDFRASERAFQLMTQVSGRAGRRAEAGKVLIQTYQTEHPILEEVKGQRFQQFFQRELQERKAFNYPPFNRLIKISLKHKDPQLLNEAAKLYVAPLKAQLGSRVIGPSIPGIPRIRNLFIQDILLKLEKSQEIIALAKQLIKTTKAQLQATKGFGSVRVNIDVDPM